MNNEKSTHRDKLGLALAGGGFRASLFHLGVLRRMAEMDILRYVEVLSTVSGGSIIGALYILLLKKHMHEKTSLSQEDYVDITKELEEILVAGIKKNLRTRLFMNPLGILRVLITSDSLGKRMARIYERYLYRNVVEQIERQLQEESGPQESEQSQPSWWSRWFRPGYISLKDTKIRPGEKEVVGGFEAYNKSVVEEKVTQGTTTGSVITHLVLNATSLNSGAPFWFSSIEVGDPRLGFFRDDELKCELLPFKRLLHEIKLEKLAEALRGIGGDTLKIDNEDYPVRRVSLAHWWQTGKKRAPGPHCWKTLFKISNLSEWLINADFGRLRRMKLAAWYIGVGYKFDPQITGGLSKEEHFERFWALMREIDADQAEELKKNKECEVTNEDLELLEKERQPKNVEEQLLSFVMELYYMRSAEVMSKKIRRDMAKLTLGEAVGASACFPPVFPPLIVLGIYDDAHVSRLGLTDGGVYDNVGLTALLHERCTHIIASDTSGLFDIQQRSSAGRLGMSGRIVSILMDDVAEQQRNAIRYNRRVSSAVESAIQKIGDVPEALKKLGVFHNLRGLAFFHIKSPPVEKSELDLGLDPKLIASLRTDLDGFGDVEIAALMNRGYDTADRYIRKYLADSPYAPGEGWKSAHEAPRPIHRSTRDVRKILRVGHSRFFRSLKLGAPVSWIFTLTVLTLATAITWNVSVSVRSITFGAANLILKWIKATVPWFGSYATETRISLGILIILVIAVVVVLKLLSPYMADRIKGRSLGWFRFFVRVAKFGRSYGANVLWLVGWFPIVISFVGAALAWCSHLFFYLPFRNKTRNP
jgi:predicted acylesterase/phospholipase RssA